MTNQDRSARIELARQIARDARVIPDDERDVFLDTACGGDEELKVEVLQMVDSAQTADSFLDATVLDEARDPSRGTMPKQIGRYKIRRAISTGGMGTVYEALQDSPRRRVAVKVIKTGLASPSALKRFEHESQVLGRLNHPVIAEIYEAGTFDDGSGEAPFFAMEYIEGAKPLVEWAQKKHLTARQKLKLFAQVCDAIHHGHQKGVVHRDLKPDNILVDADGRPRVIDFGVARATDSDMQVATMQTDVGQLVGTLYYMSPEQCEADPDLVDTRSDVYALGVILFELLTGRRPHQLDNVPVYDAARIIREEAPSKMSTLDRTLGGDLETIVGKALEKDKDRRYQSALELKRDIERFLSNEAIEARPPSLLYQTQMFTRRNKALVTSLSVIFIVLAATTIWSLVERGRAEQAATDARAAEEQAMTDRDSAKAAEAEIAQALATVESEKARADSERKRAEQAASNARLAEDQAKSDRDRAEAAKTEIAQALANLESEKLRADTERERAQAESERSTLVAEFLYSIMKMASPEYAQGRKFTLPELLREASGSIADSFGDEPLLEAELRLTLGRIQQKLGDLESSEPNLQRALILCERHHGTTHEMTRAVNLLLAEIWIEEGRYDQAESRLQSILLAVENESDRDDPQTIEANSQRVLMLMNTLRVDEAVEAAEDVVERSRRVLGPEHKETMNREITFTVISLQQARLSGDSSKVEEDGLAFESVERVMNTLGEMHPSTLNAKMAVNFRDFALTGRPGSTEDLKEIVLDMVEVLGPRHLDTLNTQGLLGLFYILQQDHPKAAVELQAVYDTFLEKYGRDHPETMGTASLLGATLMELDRAEEAEPLLATAWYGQKMLWGETDIRTVQAESIWAMSLMMLGRFEEANPHFDHTIEQVQMLPMHLAGQWLFGILLGKVNMLFEFEHDEEALVTAERLRTILREQDDADPDLRLQLLFRLSALLNQNDQHEEAVRRVREVFEWIPELFSEDPNQQVLWFVGISRDLLRNNKKPLLTLECTQAMIDIAESDAVIDEGERTNAFAYHGRALLDAGKAEEAIPYLQKAIVRLQELYGSDHETPIYWQSWYLFALMEAGQLEQARADALVIMPLAFRTMGPGDSRLAEGMTELLKVVAKQEPGEATLLFEKAIESCGADSSCLAEAVELFISAAPPELYARLQPELRGAIDTALARSSGDPDVIRVALTVLLLERKLEIEANTTTREEAGTRLASTALERLNALEGPGNDRLWSTTDLLESKVAALLGSDDDRLFALRAENLAARGNLLAAIEAYRGGAITAEDQDTRRMLLERADALREQFEVEKALAAEGDEGEEM